jgi:hypothetical protein
MVFTFAGANGEILISVVCGTDLGARSARFFQGFRCFGASKPENFLNVEQLSPTLSLLLFKILLLFCCYC